MELKNLLSIKNKNKLVNFGLIILALIIGINIYNNQIKKIDKLNVNKDTELKKNKLLNDIVQAEKRVDLYKKVLYKKDASSIINNITKIAHSSQVEITSVRPEREKEYSAYNEISIALSIVAPNYHKIGEFVSRLENNPEFYIIDDFSIKPQAQLQDSADAYRLSAELKVTVVIFKE